MGGVLAVVLGVSSRRLRANWLRKSEHRCKQKLWAVCRSFNFPTRLRCVVSCER